MAKILFIFVTSILLLSIFSCDLDYFLFDNKSVDRYELPGNTIPDSLLELVS